MNRGRIVIACFIFFNLIFSFYAQDIKPRHAKGLPLEKMLRESSLQTEGGLKLGKTMANEDDNWDERFAFPGLGLDGNVYAIAVSGSDVYVGGAFTLAGGVSVNHIAKWDGSAWSSLGNGVNLNVNAIAVSGSDVYVGGRFTQAGGVGANYIAKWNGGSWSSLGSGVDAEVLAIDVSGSDVYVGGQFNQAGGITASYAAKWDGSAWSSLKDGVNSTVYAIAMSGSDVYMGGLFHQAGGVEAKHIAKWDGNAWSSLGSGVNSDVGAIAVSGTEMYAGGSFTSAGGNASNCIAKWDGSSWSPLGNGVNNGYVEAISVTGSDVYVGGVLNEAGGVADYIAKWNGSSWSLLGSGANRFVDVISVSGSDVYVGGRFTQAGGKPSSYIACWHESVSKPGIPFGNTNPKVDTIYTYRTTGAISNMNHPLEYRFNWGDGTTSAWDTSKTAFHDWNTIGPQNVTVDARCQMHPDVKNTSDALVVNFQPVETVSKPGIPTGEANPTMGIGYSYISTGAVSNLGHRLEYRFNWGDGTASAWDTSKSSNHTWNSAGNLTVTIEARCQTHTEKINASDGLVVNVLPAETVSKPGIPVGEANPTMGIGYSYISTGAVSNLGHRLEYRFNWGDGTTSVWDTSKSSNHTWNSAGNVTVTIEARCQTHTEKINASDGLVVNVLPAETVSKPGIPAGEANPTMGIGYSYISTGAVSNLGHRLEYRFNWGDGTTSAWDTSKSTSHDWSAAGRDTVMIEARCQTHTDKMNISDRLVVNVQPVNAVQEYKLEESLPTEFALSQNYPNPFNPTTHIRFDLPRASELSLVAYNAQGRIAAILYEGRINSGYHELTWNASAMPSGVYIIRMKAEGFQQARKVFLVK